MWISIPSEEHQPVPGIQLVETRKIAVTGVEITLPVIGNRQGIGVG